MDKVLIYVKVIQPQEARSESSSILQVFADPSQNGCHLRQRVACLSGQCPSDFRLIFAGKEITDAQVIQELDIMTETLIHAVPRSQPPINEKYGSGEATTEIKNAHSCTAALTDSEAAVRSDRSSLVGKSVIKPRFYLFCKNHCLSVQPGKLRARCTLCKDDAFLVAQDPEGWNDVMLPGRISGTCLALECHGETAEFYFKCVNHTASSEDNVIPLPLIRTNLHRAMCITCAEVLDPVFMFPCTASHVVCLECFSQYCQIGLDERRFTFHTELGYTLPCPAGCEDSLIPETHHFLVLGKEQYTRYKRFGAEECLLQVGGVLCPSPGCGAGIVPDFDERRVICQQEGGFGCGFVFCRECHEAYHEGECKQQTNQPGQRLLASTMNEERHRQAKWELEESKKTMEKTSKPCPKCRVPVERSGGCMHMTCSRAQCKYEWCWVCGIGWNTTCLQDHWFGTDVIR